MRNAIKLLGIGAALAGAVYATAVIRRRILIRRLERESGAVTGTATTPGGETAEVFFVPVVEEAVIVTSDADVDVDLDLEPNPNLR